jgi:hypothetical protein
MHPSPSLRRAAALLAIIGFAGIATPAAVADPVVMAAGDIACQGCQQKATSDLLVAQRSSPEGLAAVLSLGDNEYPNGALSDFKKYYDPTWGRLKPLIHPVPGNHDPGSGYYSYFGAAAGPRGKGFYSFDIGTWHLIALNSCYGVSCRAGGEQERWLRADLAAHPAACTLAFWHDYDISGVMHDLAFDLDAAGADVVLAGHDHAWGMSSFKGIREFIAGTGGAPGPSRYGVIKLTLHPTSYDWRFVPVGGGSGASGTGRCRGSMASPPPPPPPPDPGRSVGPPASPSAVVEPPPPPAIPAQPSPATAVAPLAAPASPRPKTPPLVRRHRHHLVAVTLAGAERQAVRLMLRRLGQRWATATTKHVACHRVAGHHAIRCRVSWSSRGARRHAMVAVAQRGSRSSVRRRASPSRRQHARQR